MATKKPAEKPSGRAQEQRSILINFVLDRSGSMDIIRSATISGFNEFLVNQQKEGGDAAMTLTLFDTGFDLVAQAVPVREITPLDLNSYQLGGCTALYDAIGHTMRLTDDYVAAHNPDQVLFVVMTDGEENASREFTRDTIFRMISDRQAHAGYEFMYLGANQDSYGVSRNLGMNAGRSMDYGANDAEASAMMRKVSRNVSAYRRHGAKQVDDASFFSQAFEELGADDYEEHKRKKQQGDPRT